MASENNRSPLFLCVAPSGLEPALSEFRGVMGDRPFDVFNEPDGGEPEFSGRRSVVDLGGWGRREQTAAAVAAGIELWHVLGYGLDHLDLQYLLSNGVTVAHTPGTSSATALAEHAMMLMLNCARQMREQIANLETGEFWHPWTNELGGKRLLLLGVGASGRELAPRAASFQMDVVGIDAVVGDQEGYRRIGISFVKSPDALYELLPTADVVSLHLPLTRETHHILDARALSLLKRGAIIVNVARGALIDEQALLASLNNGSVRAAGLDVFEHEVPGYCPDVARHPHVIATPHTAGVTYETGRRRAHVIVDNLGRLERGEPIAYTVTARDDFVVTEAPDK
jgi:D-3-phosphoglycerate dehydrogenase / 2-oxoglutarate reductase